MVRVQAEELYAPNNIFSGFVSFRVQILRNRQLHLVYIKTLILQYRA